MIAAREPEWHPKKEKREGERRSISHHHSFIYIVFPYQKCYKWGIYTMGY